MDEACIFVQLIFWSTLEIKINRIILIIEIRLPLCNTTALSAGNLVSACVVNPVGNHFIINAKPWSVGGDLDNAFNKNRLEPWFVTGFTDAEGCFSINITKSETHKIGFKVELCFYLCLNKKDKVLLEWIKKFFEVGSITNHKAQALQYRVSSIKDLAKIIDHFDKYPLITQKLGDYFLFKEVFNIINRKEHLMIEGLQSIINIRASANLGLSDKLKAAFPNVVPVDRPLVKNQIIRDPNWLAGFTAGEGCFMVLIKKSATTKLGETVNLAFKLTQNSRDEQLMRSLIKYLHCGQVYSVGNWLDFKVTKFDDIIKKIIPFFQKHPIHGVKMHDLADFCQVAEMMKVKKHITLEGLEQIRKIKAGMNRGR